MCQESRKNNARPTSHPPRQIKAPTTHNARRPLSPSPSSFEPPPWRRPRRAAIQNNTKSPGRASVKENPGTPSPLHYRPRNQDRHPATPNHHVIMPITAS